MDAEHVSSSSERRHNVSESRVNSNDVTQSRSVGSGNGRTEKRQNGQQQREFLKRRRSLLRQKESSSVNSVKLTSAPATITTTIVTVPTSLSCSVTTASIPGKSMISEERES